MFQRVLVTGAAGFIGFHLALQLCESGRDVLGYDCVNDYYDVALKEARLRELAPHKNFSFIRADLNDQEALDKAFADFRPDAVVNLAAQAGVRYSLVNPRAYIRANIDGFMNVLEACRDHKVGHLVYASSSSVYGANKKVPFSVNDNVDHPVNLYAASKKANELMAHTYAHLYGIPCTGLRFFTVYGPWGRPDMAVYKFTEALYDSRPIDVHNDGRMSRDFTYIDDVTEAVTRLIDLPPASDKDAASDAPSVLYNIGNHNPVAVGRVIAMLEAETGIGALHNPLPLQPGEMLETFADVDSLRDAIGFAPSVSLETGLSRFVAWYRDYKKLGNGPVLQDARKAQ